jgi:hypothetical protein
LNLRPSGYELTQGEFGLAYEALTIVRKHLTLRGIWLDRSITGRHPTSHDLRSPRHRQVTGREFRRRAASLLSVLSHRRTFAPKWPSAPRLEPTGETSLNRLPWSSEEPPGPLESDPVVAALACALSRASDAGRFDVVAQRARELEAHRCARAGNVVRLEPARPKGGDA